MNVQVIHDSKGNPTGVFIPVPDWDKLKKKYPDLAQYEHETPSVQQLTTEMKEALLELKAVEQGIKQTRPLSALLDEL